MRTSPHLPNLPNFELGPLPRPPAEAGPDRIVGCESDSTSIGSPGLPGYLYIWQPATGLSNANSPQPRAGVTATTRYVLTVIDSSRSCENVSTDTVTIALRPPSPIALDAGPDRQGCPGQALGLGGDAAPHWTYQWNPTAGLSDPATSHPSLRTTRSQTYTLRVTDTSGTCPRVGLDSVSITIGSPQLAEAGPDISQCDGISMRDTLMALPIEGASYRWTPSLGLSDPSLARPVVSVSQSQKYQLEVTVDTFCISRDSVLVQVEPCTQVIAPNAFSPNGDGINETFRITNLPPGSILEVWNRWGRRVYQNAHYDNSWQAENLPEGVYVWWLKTPQGETLTGTVTVIR